MRIFGRYALTISLTAALAAASTAGAVARQVSVQDSFEKGSAGWTVTGGLSIVSPTDAKAAVKQRSGASYLLISNPMPFPATSLASTFTVPAKKGDRCTFELWLRMPASAGGIKASVQGEGPLGSMLGEKRIAAPTRAAKKARHGYAVHRLNFAHPGTPFFVSIRALGPVEAALDDVSLVCSTR